VAATPSNAPFLATPRGRLTLVMLCAVAFLDFVDASITNIALPSIRQDLHMSVQNLQWIPSGYLLTYGGFMLLGGRAADLLGRRRVLVAGTLLFGAAALAGGLAPNSATLIGSRLAQGVGAAMMLPAALSILTTTYREGPERRKALGAWGGMAGLGSAAGVLLGGVLTQGPGWRWVFLVKPPLCAIVLAGVFLLLEDDRRRGRLAHFDIPGALLATVGALLLLYALVRAPAVGWGSARTIGELAGAAALLAAFVVNEQRAANPLLPLSIFRIKGLAAADITQLVGIAGMFAVFFFLTLYLQDILGYSPIRTGLAYLPVTAGVGLSASLAPRLIGRLGIRPVLAAGTLVAGGGVYWLSWVPIHGSYPARILPGLVILSVGLGAEFVAATTAANAGVPPQTAGLAAALFNSSQWIGGALGLAIFTAIATARTSHLLASHAPAPVALDAGFHRALLTASIFLLAASLVALRTTGSSGEPSAEPLTVVRQEPASNPTARSAEVSPSAARTMGGAGADENGSR
jgi:EmrB/QacA subfamily drug resistance transporter